MRRREVITLLGGAAAWPLPARAQQTGATRRIGVLVNNEEADPAMEYAHRFRGLYAGVCWCPSETRTCLVRFV